MLAPALAAVLARYADRHHGHGGGQAEGQGEGQGSTRRQVSAGAQAILVLCLVAAPSWVGVAAPLGHVLTLAHVIWAPIVVWYLWLDLRLGALCGLLVGMAFPIAAVAPRSWVLTLGALAALALAVVRLLGPRRSGSPAPWIALGKVVLDVFIAPLFLAARAVGMWPDAANLLLGGPGVR